MHNYLNMGKQLNGKSVYWVSRNIPKKSGKNHKRKSRIIAHSVFDLEEPDDYDEFMYVAKLIIDTCKEHGEECRLKNGLVLNFIYNKIKKFDVARGIFTWEIDNALEEWINVPEAHIQLCVRNPECIKSFKLL